MKKNKTLNFDRRSFLLGSAGIGLLSTGLISSNLSNMVANAILPSAMAGETSQPKRGGILKMGIGGGSTSDNLDPRLLKDWVPVNQAYMIMNGLVEIDKDGKAIPELFESWQPSPDAKSWTFKLRQGVEFHNGKSLTVEDVLYSLNLHRGDTISGARSIAAAFAQIEKISDSEIRIVLTDANADLPYVLSDYHFLVVPDGWSDFNNPVGTGPFTMESNRPGVRAHFKRYENYWKPNSAYVDGVEMLVVNDISARTNALMSGQVHVINQLDYKTVDLLKRRPNLNIVQSASGQYFSFSMNCSQAPFTDNNIRLAIKHSIDREQLLKTALRGYGKIGNDHPIPQTDRFFNTELAQTPFDPEKAKFYLKQAGMSQLKVQLSSSDAVFAGAVDAAAVYRVSAAKAGIDVSIKREPVDGYWDNVWMKVPFCMSYRGGRPTIDQALSIAYASNSTQNDTFWKNDKFDAYLLEARGMLDEAKRKDIYFDLQEMVNTDGGAMIPIFGDYLDAASNKVGGITTHPLFNLMGCRMAEKVWLETA